MRDTDVLNLLGFRARRNEMSDFALALQDHLDHLAHLADPYGVKVVLKAEVLHALLKSLAETIALLDKHIETLAGIIK